MRLGLVASRYGAEATGELPARARVVAEGLAARGHAVTVLTTTALDPVTWESVLPRGASREGQVEILRFPSREALVSRLGSRQGFEALLFFGQDEKASRDGMAAARGPCALAPVGDLGQTGTGPGGWVLLDRATTVLYASAEERAFVGERRGRPLGEVVGYGMRLEPTRAASAGGSPAGAATDLGRYVVHAGPLEARDGCAAMVEDFLRYQRAARSSLSLALVGRGRVELHESAHVRLLGELGGAERARVIAGARAALVPSRREALSPLLLEAWNEARPVVACGPSAVLRGTVERTGGGLACRGFDELAGALELLEADAPLADALGAAGRRALESEHALPVVLDRYERALAELIRGRSAA